MYNLSFLTISLLKRVFLIEKQKGLFAKEFITDTFKDFIKGLPQAIALNIFNQTFVTEYEKKQKRI